MSARDHTRIILDEVRRERDRQDRRWGQQDIPDLSPALEGVSIEEIAARIGSADGGISSADFLLKETVGVIESAAAHDDVQLRKELIDVAAVALVWIESIDQRTGKIRHSPDLGD